MLVTVPVALWGRTKVLALEQGKPVGSIVSAALRMYLASWKDGSEEEQPIPQKSENPATKLDELKSLIGSVVSGRDLLNQKTAEAKARESRRGQDEGSQEREDDLDF